MIGIMGTGSMGSAIAEGLLSAGRDVIVFNRTSSKTEALAKLGARVARSPEELIEASDLIVTVLADAAATRALLLTPEVKPALNGKMILNVAHTTVEEILELAQDLEKAGAVLSEVNVTVYPDPVRSRQGHFNVACAAEHKDVWISLLSDLGSHVHFVGPVGNASKAELALWLSYMFLPVAIAYSAAAFVKLDLPTDALISALSENPTLRIAGAESLVPQMIFRRYRKDSFSVDNFAYSVQIVKAEAEQLGLPTELMQLIEKMFKDASAIGCGASDVAAVYEAIAKD